MTATTIKILQERVFRSELGCEFVQDPLLDQDVWPLTLLGYSQDELGISRRYNLYFDGFHLLWLKLLAKLTIKARVRERQSSAAIIHSSRVLRQLDEFLIEQGRTRLEDLTDGLLQEFIKEVTGKRRVTIVSHAVKLWAEEGWLDVPFIQPEHRMATPKIEIIPEEVLHQIYENLDMFPPPLERLFRLQLALGCRISEMFWMPRACLKEERNQWLLLRWIAKQKKWSFYAIHPLVAELVQEQQRFLDFHFGSGSKFDKLFCWLSTAPRYGARGPRDSKRFEREPIYRPEIMCESIIQLWLREFSKAADLQDRHGNRFNLTSHMFRRTKASIMSHLETEDEYIAAVLGHSSLDMLPHYRKRSLERLEKEAKTKGYVNAYGRVTAFKPKNRRYERLADLLKVSTLLGECHRPAMLGDCQYRYACLNCNHHRVTIEDRPKLKADRDRLLLDLEQAQKEGLNRRETEIKRLMELVDNRLRGLDELDTLMEEHINA